MFFENSTNIKERFRPDRLKWLVFGLVFGLLMIFLFSGKSRIDIETIAVSVDEQYIACFETGRGPRIFCFRSDGCLMFEFKINTAMSAGGHCTLWFENDEVCALFYRTGKIVYFSLDGTILKSIDNLLENRPPEFFSFVKKGHQYIYDGNQIDVIYSKGSFLGYWFFGEERYLKVITQNGATNTIYAWTAVEETGDGLREP